MGMAPQGETNLIISGTPEVWQKVKEGKVLVKDFIIIEICDNDLDELASYDMYKKGGITMENRKDIKEL